jgi:hypothetical protein
MFPAAARSFSQSPRPERSRPRRGWFPMGKQPAKTPSAPSVKNRAPAGPETKAQIVGEIYIALQRLDADEELLSIIGSWRDTLGDATVLELLRDYNAGRLMLHRPQ